jgi:hypothetical protein
VRKPNHGKNPKKDMGGKMRRTFILDKEYENIYEILSWYRMYDPLCKRKDERRRRQKGSVSNIMNYRLLQ